MHVALTDNETTACSGRTLSPHLRERSPDGDNVGPVASRPLQIKHPCHSPWALKGKWRRDRDLNPGGGLSAYTLSRRAP